MSKEYTYKGINFSDLNPQQIQRMVTDLYQTHQANKREFPFGLTADRRQCDRRQATETVLLDTRTTRCRRQSAGRRQREENQDNVHKVGIDYYV